MKTLKRKVGTTTTTSRKAHFRATRSAYHPRNGSRHAKRVSVQVTMVGHKQRVAAGRNGAGNHNHEAAKLAAAIKIFEVAVRFLQKQNYARAKELFEKLAQGDVLEVAARARVHLRMCEQKVGRPRVAPRTGEDYYALGVGALNIRELDGALEYLKKADKLHPKQEHIQYALAATQAVRGNAEAALEHLNAAIALRPQNRIQARHDEDFQRLASDPRFRALVNPAPTF